MSARLSFVGLGRVFAGPRGATVALRDVDLDVSPGSFVAIVGPSGCGKSTLLHVAAGLDTGYCGRFTRDPLTARLACMFQQPRLLPWLTVAENVRFVLQAARGDRGSHEAIVEHALERVHLADASDRHPMQLSGGMQQRCSLARALAVDPDVLLLDEPFSALDELTATAMRQELSAIISDKPRTVLLITHNIMEGCLLADRIVVMSRRPGRVVADLEVGRPRPRRLSDPHLSALAEHVLSFIETGPLSSPASAKETIDA
jgi:ABC-type nitrate/sulfonate/bicarbonate transport system ATPase subunit